MTGGHEALIKYEGERLTLECTSCGWQSNGWTIPVAPSLRGDG